MRSVARWLRDNGLSLVFLVLFIACIATQALSGVAAFNDLRLAHQRPPVSLSQYLVSGTFLDGVFANWQGAFLQLACLIVFGAKFYQRGAAHSRKPELHAGHLLRPRPRGSWAYRHSLGLAFWGFFTASFVAHALAGSRAENETRALTDQPRTTVASYVGSGSFWFKTTQAWQAEFITIAVLLLLSIHLRQEGSPESKPIGSTDEETGESNK